MRQIFLLLLLSFTLTNVIGQSARMFSMGGVSTTLLNVDAVYGNQAGLAFLADPNVSINAIQRFGISEIGNYSLAAAIPLKMGSFGLLIDYYGTQAYNEQKVGLSYARKLLKNLSIGAQFNYQNTIIPVYGNQANFSFDLGLYSKILSKLSLGVHISNPIRADKVSEIEELPTVFGMGLLYTPSENLALRLEIEKDLDYEANVKLGIDYQLVDILSLRIGANSAPATASFGIGIQAIKNIYFDIAANYHNLLGFSPAGGIRFDFNRK